MAFWKPSRPKDIESAETSARAPVEPVKPSVQSAPPKVLKPGRALQGEPGDEAADPGSKGFDPYNSGVFNRKDTWSRVNRKK